ncbi:MAG: Unknown protein [uncultured Thiotrichaceae bacterium]|uniref:Uncharacterized protein n=1 Tax=uncultured Thiotrichaceae bacterium TaxID=298394 RepID=A0A6S6TKV8_9GAMM|nr:MAG: Unknown protein [uncultured Thiotrichaceae bacterium]
MTNPEDFLKSENLPYPIWEFNYKPEKYVHTSWLKDLPNADVILKLIAEDSRKTSTRLSHHLLSQLGFDGKFFFDFNDSLTQLALWDTSEMQKLVQHIGMMFYFDDVRRCITRQEVASYRKALGEELYTFALEGAPEIKQRQLKALDLSEELSINRKLLITGMAVIIAGMQDYPYALLKRMIIKLPRSWFDDYSQMVANKKNMPGGKIGNSDLTLKLMDYVKEKPDVD